MAFGNERIHKTVPRFSIMVNTVNSLLGVLSDLLIHNGGRVAYAPAIESQQGR